MCELAVEHTSTWLMVDPWEAGQSEYKRTAIVLDHFYELLNQDEGGLVMSDGRKRKYKVMLLAGGDLIESFGEPGVWSEPDVSRGDFSRMSKLTSHKAAHHTRSFRLPHRRESRQRCMGVPHLSRCLIPPSVSLTLQRHPVSPRLTLHSPSDGMSS